MRLLTLILLFSSPTLAYARDFKQLISPPAGTTLPVSITRTLKAHNLQPGQPITAVLMQTVPVRAHIKLPRATKLDGHIVNVNNSSISLLFNQLRWKKDILPVHVRLVAAAAPSNIYDTKLPLGSTDRATSSPADWTTRQIGGDEIYLSAGSGKVYDQYSQPVGYADFSGVYANPAAPGDLPRAMGPFSTTATGLHGFREFSIISSGGADSPITLVANKPNWEIGKGSALLLEVIP
jgi:hypothetical protein